MPNWCFNYSTFICPSKEIYDKLLDSIKNNNWFETFAPLGLDPEKYENGWDYHKALQVWHTKWNAQNIEIHNQNAKEHKIEVTFETAWSPPIGVYNIMYNNFNIDVSSNYEEPGCDFLGHCFFSKEYNDGFDEEFTFPTNKEELDELRNIIGIGSDLDNFMYSTWEDLLEQWENEDDDDDEDDDEDDDDDDDDDEAESEEECTEENVNDDEVITM